MSRTKKAVLITVSVLCLILCLLCCLYIWQFFRGSRVRENLTLQARQPAAEAADSTQVPLETVHPDRGPALPVDFDVLRGVNPEIYAWIEIPGTTIAGPILQSPDDDLFYNTHGADKSYYSGGAIYTQRYNRLDFTDPMTLVYGHNFHDQSIFAPLLHFTDQSFLDEHHQILIYTPAQIYTYEIFAAYPHTSEHLLLCYDFGQEQSFRDYFSLLNTPAVNGTYRPDLFPAPGDRVLTLSTCYRLTFGQRYLVQAVLRETQLVEQEARP